MEVKTRGFYKFVLRFFVTAILLGFIFSLIDLKQFAQNLKLAHYRFLLVVWAVALLASWIEAFKLKLILRKQGCDINTSTVFRSSTVTAFYNMIMPATFGAAVKWYILKRGTNKGSNVLSAMVYNQATVFIVRVSVGLLAIMVCNWFSRPVRSLICAIITAVMVFSCFLLLNKRTGVHISTAIRFILGPFSKRLRAKVEMMVEQIMVFQDCRYRFHFSMMGFCLIVSLLDIIIYFFAARSAGINVPITALIWQSSAVYVLGRLPISIANLGVREYSLVKFLSFYGIKPPAVLLMSMIIFSARILMAAIGALWQINWAIRGRGHRLCADGKC